VWQPPPAPVLGYDARAVAIRSESVRDRGTVTCPRRQQKVTMVDGRAVFAALVCDNGSRGPFESLATEAKDSQTPACPLDARAAATALPGVPGSCFVIEKVVHWVLRAWEKRERGGSVSVGGDG
jgi:hypothetical protein